MDKENVYIELAKHCIGLDREKPYVRHGKKFYHPYRNYFATGRNHEDWETMKQAGYADRDNDKNQQGGYTYWLTRAGLDWLGERLEIHIYDESGKRIEKPSVKDTQYEKMEEDRPYGTETPYLF